ncbi:MAG TPA: phosphodiester glycosidase family protein [Candidatus Acidoferrales bacterium]|nr:phosphodiester glycosidase family protein [Candidatus Acidoferrales bacterium]
MPRVLRARWLLPFLALAVAFAFWRDTHATHWRELRPGVEFATVSGEPWCRLGSASVAVVRVDPKRARLRVHSFARLHASEPPGIVEWQRRTGALAVFNAGQFYPDWSYMGLLVAGGDTISTKPHPGFRAALVAADARAHVLDLSSPGAGDERAWSDVAQSFMLFDRSGGVRVRRSERIANRTAVGEDRRGWIVVCVSEGAYTLADFATLLQRAPLGLSHAMSMDGGLESELVVSARPFRYASFGAWPETGEPAAPGASVPLPAVIAVEAR